MKFVGRTVVLVGLTGIIVLASRMIMDLMDTESAWKSVAEQPVWLDPVESH